MQKKLTCTVNIAIRDKVLKYEDNIKYLGVIIDKNLNWKILVSFLTRHLDQKLRHLVSIEILKKL